MVKEPQEPSQDQPANSNLDPKHLEDSVRRVFEDLVIQAGINEYVDREINDSETGKERTEKETSGSTPQEPSPAESEEERIEEYRIRSLQRAYDRDPRPELKTELDELRGKRQERADSEREKE